MKKILCIIAKSLSDRQLENGWMLLFKAGWGVLKNEGKFFVDKTSFDLVSAAIALQGNDIVFDYEHQTIKGVKAPAAGWIKELAWEDGIGIKARVEWTKTAAKHLTDQEYRYFSPVFFISKSGRRLCGLHSSALTNTPKTKHLTPILAKLGLVDNKEEPMDRKQLIAAFGLKEDATDADILAAVAKAGITLPKEKATEVIPKAVVAALGLEETDGETTVVASIHALNQVKKSSVSAEDFKALQDKIAGQEATDAVDTAIAKGKITPDQKDWAQEYATDNLEGFEAFVAKAPVVVPLDQLPRETQKAKTGELTEADLAVASQMDVDPEDIKKYGVEVAHG